MSAQDVINAALKMNTLGINHGTSGNVSLRADNGLLITPSGVSYEDLTPQDIVQLDWEGSYLGPMRPSSEWRFHRDILLVRQDVNAVVHTHSKFATTLACLHKDLPPFHYMVAVSGQKSVKCAPYAIFGSQELSDHALEALGDGYACLLANHGMITVGKTLDKALSVAQEIELLCEQYLNILQTGEPILLSDVQMDDVMEKFKTYGVQSRLES